MSLVEFRDVYKRYQMGEITINAVDGISFSVEEGEFAVVVGASGAGKTTVLNILGGMDSCTEGEIIVGGRNVSRLSDRQLIEYRRYDIGFVFQFYNLVPDCKGECRACSPDLPRPDGQRKGARERRSARA